MDNQPRRPVAALRLLGPSGSGKTTLGVRLIEELGRRGYRVATIKSAHHHPAPPDRAGSDTDRYRAAGNVAGAGVFADGTVITLPDASMDTLLAMFQPVADLVLIEGFRDATLPSLLLVIDGVPRDDSPGPTVATIVQQSPTNEGAGIPTYSRDDIEGIAGAVERWLRDAVAAHE